MDYLKVPQSRKPQTRTKLSRQLSFRRKSSRRPSALVINDRVQKIPGAVQGGFPKISNFIVNTVILGNILVKKRDSKSFSGQNM